MSDAAGTGPRWPQLTFAAALMVVFVYTLVEALGLSRLGGMSLTVTGLIGMTACLAVIAPVVFGRAAPGLNYDAETVPRSSDMPGGPWGVLAWIGGFIALVALVGYVLALVGFFAAFLRRVAGVGWMTIAVLTACALGGMLVLADAMNLVMPAGLLQSQADLPWPLR